MINLKVIQCDPLLNILSLSVSMVDINRFFQSDQAFSIRHNFQVFGYPITIPFIISNEFCERFSYYGMRSKLH